MEQRQLSRRPAHGLSEPLTFIELREQKRQYQKHTKLPPIWQAVRAQLVGSEAWLYRARRTQQSERPLRQTGREDHDDPFAGIVNTSKHQIQLKNKRHEHREPIDSFSEFKEMKNIDRATMMASWRTCSKASWKKKFGEEANVDAIINPDKGIWEIWLNRVIVEDGLQRGRRPGDRAEQVREDRPDFEVGER